LTHEKYEPITILVCANVEVPQTARNYLANPPWSSRSCHSCRATDNPSFFSSQRKLSFLHSVRAKRGGECRLNSRDYILDGSADVVINMALSKQRLCVCSMATRVNFSCLWNFLSPYFCIDVSCIIMWSLCNRYVCYLSFPVILIQH